MKATRSEKTRRVSLSRAIAKLKRQGKWKPDGGWDDLTFLENARIIADSGLFRTKTLPLAIMVICILAERQPDTVRGILYAIVSAGGLPDTSKKSYIKVQRILNEARKRRIVDYRWVVDNIRSTVKPSSWSGLADFAETIQRAYRRDFWAGQRDYVCIIVEKDTVAGRIINVTREYDVALHPLRGFNSTSFNFAIAEQWAEIKKPIHVYYIGDLDPSGIAIEQDVRAKLIEYSGRSDINWKRLAVVPAQFEEFDIIPLDVKREDTRHKRFIETYGDRGAEVEAIPADKLRAMVEDAIKSHINAEEWAKLEHQQSLERQTWRQLISTMSGGEQ